ncbi:hypothetical protein ACWGJY_34835, partial [Streptomyces sp. NPDC054765]
MTAPICPHCFAPVRGDGRPVCLCAALDADDFDPLRVRPYVSLPDGDDDGGAGDDAGDGAGESDGGPGGTLASRGDRLEDLPGVGAAAHRTGGPPPGGSRAAGPPLPPGPPAAAVAAAPVSAATNPDPPAVA